MTSIPLQKAMVDEETHAKPATKTPQKKQQQHTEKLEKYQDKSCPGLPPTLLHPDKEFTSMSCMVDLMQSFNDE